MMELHEREIAGATCECCNWSEDQDDCSIYNELVFDAHVLTPEYMLPNIEAVIFPAGRTDWVENLARDMHEALKRHRVEVPLVQYHALADRNGPAFTLTP